MTIITTLCYMGVPPRKLVQSILPWLKNGFYSEYTKMLKNWESWSLRTCTPPESALVLLPTPKVSFCTYWIFVKEDQPQAIYKVLKLRKETNFKIILDINPFEVYNAGILLTRWPLLSCARIFYLSSKIMALEICRINSGFHRVALLPLKNQRTQRKTLETQ